MTTLPRRIGSPKSARRRRMVGSRLTTELVSPPTRNPLSRFHHHPGCPSSLATGTHAGKRHVRTIIPNPVRPQTDVSAPTAGRGARKAGGGRLSSFSTGERPHAYETGILQVQYNQRH
ncbi:hypothetical protein BHE74_00053453 [Ensete ventricosum]|uniref:Uncharacterized protein n=1 Tax=Ensete ventricosum TaxID=4639 RepID=A0A426XBN4_ENSVE|nr:hypothetical protein B296_00048412 [Ensete ventricosum]RWW41089.1 hypothetical protein BHE74_00053453 [Ensete ventricosum]